MPHDIQPYSDSLLGILRNANFNSTGDQPIVLDIAAGAKYIIEKIVVTNASAALGLAVGGIYTAASKGGTAVVSALQAYTGVSGTGKFLAATLASILGTDIRNEATLYLSLTTPKGSAATADVAIYGRIVP